MKRVKCDGKIAFESSKKEDLGFKIKVSCDKCKDPRYVPSSEKIKGGNTYEVNHRFAFVMRVLGLGLAECKFFASTVKEEKEATCKANKVEEANELTVSGDETLKKRGFSSLFGVSSLIGYYTDKVFDVFIKSSYCHDCVTWERKLDTAEFEEWHEEHVHCGKCKANHAGPSGNMEVDAIIQMFKRSLEYFEGMFRNYIGDGDSKAYSSVVNSKPYGEDFTTNNCSGRKNSKRKKK